MAIGFGIEGFVADVPGAMRSPILVFLLSFPVLTGCSLRPFHNPIAPPDKPDRPEDLKANKSAFDKLVTILPGGRKKAFYGNYGGPGNKGGKPVDRMDAEFQEHDFVYVTAGTYDELRASDKELIRDLRAIPEEELSEEGKAYRDRAIGFFTWPGSVIVGKPMMGSPDNAIRRMRPHSPPRR